MRNRFFHWTTTAVLVGVILFPTFFVHAASVDLALSGNTISFSQSTLYVGDTIRIYARVRNVGDTDATAHVLFYQGGMLIGQSQPVSLRTGGSPDDVFVDFTVPDGTFNIRAVLQGSSPQDENPENDTAITPLYSPIADADRDSVVDSTDNCVNDTNADQLDSDNDGTGDVCDTDDDNDAVIDVNDPAPLDATVTGVPEPEPEPEPVAAAVPAVATPAPSPSASVIVSTDAASVSSVTEEGEESGEVSVLDRITSSTSKLSTSPLARFTSKHIDWRTYEFTLADQPADGVRFSWDFGDGATSVQSKITHAFSGPGTYTVTVAIVNADGTVLSDAQIFDVSFFHLENPQVLMIISALLVLLFLCGFAFIKLRKSYDKGAFHE